MSRNVELKVRLQDLAAAEAVARGLGAELHSIERQHDTYFRVSSGRLKLRQRWLGDQAQPSELIFYHRPDQADARLSDYTLLKVGSGEELRALLAAALGIGVEVIKSRTVYLHDNVRIHLDRVDGLGSFLEFEAIVDDTCTEDAADAKVTRLRQAFALRDDHVIGGSYSDLFAAAKADPA